MNDRPLLAAQQLTKIFRLPAQSLEVLRGVDLNLHKGEMVALLGSSGSGKSTLLQILGTLDRPSTGRILFDGQSLEDLNDTQRAALRNQRIGFIYQFHHLLPEFSALENVMMPFLIARQSHRLARDKAVQMLTEVGLKDRLHHKPGQLSGGEQQRVAIARAVVTNPDLLLADEPTGNLDRHTAAGVFELLRQLNQDRQLTCLMVTHNPELAASLDRRLYMVDGRLTDPE